MSPEDRQAVMAFYQARHRTTARRRFHATTEARPAPVKLWKPAPAATCALCDDSGDGKYKSLIKRLA